MSSFGLSRSRRYGATSYVRYSRNVVFRSNGLAPTVRDVNPSAQTRERAVDKIARLAAEPRDVVSFWQASTEVLNDTISYYWTPCWYTLDPASLLVTSHFHYGMAEMPPEFLYVEYSESDAHDLVGVATSVAGISTLHEATRGDPSQSPRWKLAQTMGSDQELILRLRARSGEVWGSLSLYREPERPMFDAADKRFLLALGPHLAEGARRALLMGEANDPEGLEAPGLLILNDRCEIESTTPGVQHWLSTLPDGDSNTGRLPSAVMSLAGRAIRHAENPGQPNEILVSRVLSSTGTWVVLHGASLISDGSRRVAIIVEPAHPARIYPLLMSAYGLTERERDITQLILQGESTTQIAAQLVVSVHTVQQHLKSIFDKTGVHSRRDLVAKVFFTHYEPRLRDNEQRTMVSKPIRGGPMSSTT
jgi:DNA-binding CsgD family transcriptional regulator